MLRGGGRGRGRFIGALAVLQDTCHLLASLG